MEQESENEIISLIKDVQKRLIYLEKKIDLLSAQASEITSRGKNYGPPSKTYGKPQRFGDKRESRFGAPSTRSGRSFKKKRGDKDQGFSKRRKPFKPASQKRSQESK